MKTRSPIKFAALLSACGAIAGAAPLGTGFTYQGQLSEGGAPARGSYDLCFAVYTAPSGPGQIVSSLTNPAVSISNGLFKVLLDFGPDIFTGEERWLEVAVRPSGAAPFNTLTPCQPLTPVPYASYAANAGAALTAGSATWADSAISFSGLLAGDVTGPQGATLVSTVGGVSAVNVAVGANAANAATNSNLPGALVKRNASGDFAAGTITASYVGNGAGLSNLTAAALVGTAPRATNFTGPLIGDVTGQQGATAVGLVGGVTAANVASGANAANAATNVHAPGAIVRRDACDGNFAAGAITARFIGDGSGLTNLPTSPNQYGAPIGAVLASVVAQDATLIAGGYRQIMAFSAPAWVNGATSNAPSARAGHTAVWDGQRMIVWGGTVGASAYTASGGMYDANDDVWTATSTINAPAARSGHTAVWTGSEMIVWGGQVAAGSLGTGGRFVPGTQTWSPVTTSGAPSVRNGHVAVWTGSRMIVWGGLHLSEGLLNDGALYDPSLNRMALR